MADYNILVKNKSGLARAYFLFVEPPKISGVGSGDVYQNVYITAPSVPNGTGTASIRVHKDFYAVTGTSPTPLGANVSVTTGDYEIANICQDVNGHKRPGSTTHVTFKDGGVQFDTGMLAQNCTSDGSFAINTDTSFQFPNPDNIFIGMGALDPHDSTNIVPVATFPAQPGTTNIVTPVTKYWISWGTFTPGQIIDVATIATPAEVDFTGKAASLAKVVHNNDGTWDVTYNS